MPANPRVQLFIPCLVDQFFPSVGKAMVEICSALGYEILYPYEQTCCGQWAYNMGDFAEAKKLAERFLTIFNSPDPIVSPSGSCVYMVRHHYPELFKDNPGKLTQIRKLGSQLFEASEFLFQKHPDINWKARKPVTVTYHESCHLKRGLGISAEPRFLLKKTEGLTFVEMEEPDRCCGFGGLFSTKFPEISGAILEDKISRILATGAEVVTGGDVGCLLNMEPALKDKARHITISHFLELMVPAL